MEADLNCSSWCDPSLCSIQSGIDRREGLDILQKLCGLSTVVGELPRRPHSPVLNAVVWTLLSCGILLTFGFLIFTLRFRNNRIVKMSSPNLNVLTLFGSVLTYSSGFLFALDERTHSQGGASPAVLQARLWTLCIGSTLVFGPILGKTWRLYRVFTQRMPDKRVIIRDVQLMGLVALLILVDMLVLTVWHFTDPFRCSRSVAAVVKVLKRDVSFSLSELDTCSSLYSDLWIIVIALQKGCLLLYGTYLAGLTSDVSLPPVNQSPTILTVVTLVGISSAVAAPVSIFLQTWPNLLYSTVAGAIFTCTLATNCMLFVPQLTQWRQFEEDQNSLNQMAKYFSSPSRSQPSVYSQDEIYYLLGENSSMKKLLNEKIAVIDSLQEQVSNAKEKLLRLMSASRTAKERDMDSSNTNLNSSSTQATELLHEGPCSSPLPPTDTKSQRSPTHPSPVLTVTAAVAPFSEPPSAPDSSSHAAASALPADVHMGEIQRSVTARRKDIPESRAGEDLTRPSPPQPTGCLRTAEETVHFVTSLQPHRALSPTQAETFTYQRGPSSLLGSSARLAGFVSSEQLQEILQELSVDAVMERSLRSPNQTSRTPSPLKRPEASAFSPPSLNPPVFFRYPSISPYAMRKRRPPFHSSRRALARFYTDPEPAACRMKRNTCEHRNLGRRPNGVRSNDLEMEEVDAEADEMIARCHRCVPRSHRCSAFPCAEHNQSPDVEAGSELEQHRRHIRDSCGSWDSDSSSSTDYCYYHRPYCESCLQRGTLLSSDSSSDSSDSECEGFTGLYRSPHPVVFNEDIKPTFV
ncbi:probable G-protein coupled receptor 156 [Brachionichthys hirsutus]|uniref:probable G-protein coupled receptor 156 n=1 Tax=Brachionichthys hirsutus TaxID=412623 RepID=UPI003604F2CF